MSGTIDVLIIGGGITGLSAAYELQQQAGRPVSWLLVEADARLGGKVQTERAEGLVIEQGPDSFLARKTAARDLVTELGLAGGLVGTNPHIRKTYVVHRRKLVPLPDTMMLVAPTEWAAYVRTPLLSLPGKLRAALDVVIPPARRPGDESIGQFVTRRLGREVAVRLAGPLLSGVYAGDMDELSILATFPQLRELEQQHGSLLKGLRALRRRAPQQSPTGRAPTGSAFLTLQSGLVTVVEALQRALPAANVITGQAVVGLRRSGGGYSAQLSGGSQVIARMVIVTAPAFAAAKLLQSINPAASTEAGSIPYVSTAAVALAYSATAATRPLDATGFIVPADERRIVTGCTWVTQKWPHTTPDGTLLIRCFVGRAGGEHVLQWSDDDIVHAVKTELKQLMGLIGEPHLSRVYRWPQAMPQYTVGHRERIVRLEQAMQATPGLLVAGAGYRGLGVPDCIVQGREAARQALAQLRKS